MTGQQLRNSILQEAIHGRLVPNVLQPGEKTGEELLKDIIAERQKKENEEKGKKAKKLTLSTIEEEPWELPDEWCWCKLGDVGSWGAGATPQRGNAAYYQEGTIPWLKTGELNNGVVYDTEEKVTELALKQCSLRLCQPEDVLIAMYGATIGKLAIAGVPLTTNQACCACTPYTGIYNKYLFFYLLAKKDDFTMQAFGGAQPNISKEKIIGTDFPLPPLSIQKAIVEKIEDLLPLIDEYDKAAVELETLNKILPDKLRKSVLQEAIHGTLVPNDIPEGEATGAELLQQILAERQDKEDKEKGKKAKKLTLSTIEEEPWELPDGWCWARLGDVMTFVNGRAYKKEELLSSGKYKVLRVGNFFTNDSWYYSDLELPDEKYCFKGDLLYAWSASFGPWIWDGEKTIFHYHIWNVKFNEDKLYKKYLYWFFEADKHIIKESTTGSTMVHVSMENMMPRLIPIPPLSIQHRIVEKIEEVFSAINKLQA